MIVATGTTKRIGGKMTIKKFLELVKHKINGGGEFCWDCYGNNAFALDSYRKQGSLSIVFDLKNQNVYEFGVCDYKDNKAYKWIDPGYKEKHDKENKKRGFKTDQAWDDVNYEVTSIRSIFSIAKKVSNRK